MATKAGIKRRAQANCRRKIPYETFKNARDAARLVRQLIHELVLPYRCPLVRTHYHIGHPPKLNDLSWNDARTRE